MGSYSSSLSELPSNNPNALLTIEQSQVQHRRAQSQEQLRAQLLQLVLPTVIADMHVLLAQTLDRETLRAEVHALVAQSHEREARRAARESTHQVADEQTAREGKELQVQQTNTNDLDEVDDFCIAKLFTEKETKLSHTPSMPLLPFSKPALISEQQEKFQCPALSEGAQMTLFRRFMTLLTYLKVLLLNLLERVSVKINSLPLDSVYSLPALPPPMHVTDIEFTESSAAFKPLFAKPPSVAEDINDNHSIRLLTLR